MDPNRRGSNGFCGNTAQVTRAAVRGKDVTPTVATCIVFVGPGHNNVTFVEGIYYETLEAEAEMVMEKESQNSKLANQILPATQKWIK